MLGCTSVPVYSFLASFVSCLSQGQWVSNVIIPFPNRQAVDTERCKV